MAYKVLRGWGRTVWVSALDTRVRFVLFKLQIVSFDAHDDWFRSWSVSLSQHCAHHWHQFRRQFASHQYVYVTLNASTLHYLSHQTMKSPRRTSLATISAAHTIWLPTACQVCKLILTQFFLICGLFHAWFPWYCFLFNAVFSWHIWSLHHESVRCGRRRYATFICNYILQCHLSQNQTIICFRAAAAQASTASSHWLCVHMHI